MTSVQTFSLYNGANNQMCYSFDKGFLEVTMNLIKLLKFLTFQMPYLKAQIVNSSKSRYFFNSSTFDTI